MTLPASLTPPLSYVNKAPISMDGTGRGRAVGIDAPDALGIVPGRHAAPLRQGQASAKSQSGDAALFGDRKPAVRVDANRDGSSSSAPHENGVLTLRRILDIRARSETAELVELPVPVTEILRISLGNLSVEPMAAINARSLYEGAQELFSDAASPPLRQSAPAPALQAA